MAPVTSTSGLLYVEEGGGLGPVKLGKGKKSAEVRPTTCIIATTNIITARIFLTTIFVMKIKSEAVLVHKAYGAK